MKTDTITRHLRCILTDKELLEVSKQSAELTRAIVTLEEDKGRISKDFAARIAEREASRSILTDKVLTGYEFRNVPCTVLLNHPKTGLKTITRDDTSELVATEQMTPDEMQEELPLDQEPAADPTKSGDEAEDARSSQGAVGAAEDDNVNLDDREALIGEPVKSAFFNTALENANLGTLKAALNACIQDKIGGRRRARLEEQLAKLEAANTTPAAKTTEDGFIWDDDGMCQNPISLTVTSPGIVTFSIQSARTSDGDFRRGFAITDIEPDADMFCDRFTGYTFDTAEEAFGCAFEDVVTHFEKGKAHGVREYAVTLRTITMAGIRSKIINAAIAAAMENKSATLDLASQ